MIRKIISATILFLLAATPNFANATSGIAGTIHYSAECNSGSRGTLPTNVHVSARTLTSVTISWDPPVCYPAGPRQYLLKYSGDNGSTWNYPANPIWERSLKVTGLVTGKKYLFLVSVLDGGLKIPGVAEQNQSNYALPVALSSGRAHHCLLDSAYQVKCWGANDRGQSGATGSTVVSSPNLVIPKAIKVVSGLNHSCAMIPTENDFSSLGFYVKCWGANNQGQLGNGLTDDSSVPVRAGLFNKVVNIFAGDNFTCALSARDFSDSLHIGQSSLRCWGDNSKGQLPDVSESFAPTPVRSLLDITNMGVSSFAAGTNHLCIARWDNGLDGTVDCWGSNESGELGVQNPQVSENAFTSTNMQAQDIAAGDGFTCIRERSNLSHFAWKCRGSNSFGQLGNGKPHEMFNPSDENAPFYQLIGSPLLQEVLDIPLASNIDARGDNACAYGRDARLICWGNNPHGVFPATINDSVSDHFVSTPKPIATDVLSDINNNNAFITAYSSPNFQTVSVGIENVCYIRSDFSVTCLGANTEQWQTCLDGVCNVNGLTTPVITVGTAASAVTKLVSTSTKAKTNKLVWSGAKANGSAITKYEVRWKLSTASKWGAFKSYAKATTATVTGWLKGKKYNVQIKVSNAIGATVSKTFTVTQTK